MAHLYDFDGEVLKFFNWLSVRRSICKMQARSVPKSGSCSDCTTLFGPRRPCHMCQLFQFKAIQNNYSVRKIVPFLLPEKWFELSFLIWEKKNNQPTDQPNKQTTKKNEFQVQSIVRSSVILGLLQMAFE